MDFILQHGHQLVYILGITNLTSLFLVFFSCRCMMGNKFFVKLMHYPWYKRYYSTHCYFWWIFFISVALHAVLALYIFGNPFSS